MSIDGDFSYLNPYGWASSAAGAVAQGAVRLVAYATLPASGLYNDEIQALRAKLYDQTGASIASECAKVISQRQVHKIFHHLNNVHTLGPKDAESGALKNFLDVVDGVVVINTTGQSFLTVLTHHTDLVEETFELNILRAMNNGTTYLKNLQQKNPYFLVKLAQDAMKEVASVSNKPISDDAEHHLFMQKLQQIVLKALFPNQDKDIEIPISLQGWLNSSAFLKIQEKALPRKIAKLYNRAVSDVMKYKILAKAVLELKSILSTAPETTEKKSAEKGPLLAPYAEQEEFNQQLGNAAGVFIDNLNSKSLRLVKPLIAKTVAAQGEKVVEKIASIRFEELLNHSLKLVCKKLNPEGAWQQVDGKDVFSYVQTTPKTVEQKEQHREQQLLHNRQVITATIDTIAHDVSGLIMRVAPSKKKEKSSPQSTMSRVLHAVSTIFRKVIKAFVRFFFAVFQVDRHIAKVSKKVIAFAEQVDLKQAAKPFKRTIIQTSM